MGNNLVATVRRAEKTYGVPIVNTRVAVTHLLLDRGYTPDDFLKLAQALERAAQTLGIDFIGGFSALVEKGYTHGDHALLAAIPKTLASTTKVCSSVNVASTKAGINMDAVLEMANKIKEAAELTREQGGLACAKLVVFANAPEDNPFMAGSFHGVGESEAAIKIGISGPGVVRATVERCPDLNLGDLAEEIKRVAFKITRWAS